MKKFLWGFIKLFVISCVVLALVLAASLVLSHIAPQTLHTFTHLTYIFSQNNLVFTLFRWIVIIIFYCLWPWLVRRKSWACAWTEKKEDYWLRQRVRVIIWLVIFEVLIAENLLWKIL